MDYARWNDVSNWEPNWRISLPTICKAGEGLAYTDPTYQRFKSQAASAGQFFGAYYALHTGSPVDQARRAAGIIGKTPAMWDCERWPAESGSPAGMVNLAELLTAIDTYRAIGGIMNVVYLPRSQWQAMGSPDLAPLRLRKVAIVNADYRSGSQSPTHPAWDSIGGSPVFAVQYAPCQNAANMPWADAHAIWTAGTTITPTAPPEHTDMTYVVQPGDTMSSIAARHGLSVRLLESLNLMAGHPAGNFNVIWPGDRLRLAVEGTVVDTYTVHSGDTLSGIASRYKMTTAQIEALNPHAGHPAGNFNVIWPGDVLTVHL